MKCFYDGVHFEDWRYALRHRVTSQVLRWSFCSGDQPRHNEAWWTLQKNMSTSSQRNTLMAEWLTVSGRPEKLYIYDIIPLSVPAHFSELIKAMYSRCLLYISFLLPFLTNVSYFTEQCDVSFTRPVMCWCVNLPSWALFSCGYADI